MIYRDGPATPTTASLKTRVTKLLGVASLVTLMTACGSGGSGGVTQQNTAPARTPNAQILSDGASGNWSNPATWNGAVPAKGANVVIPAGQTVILDTNINIATLTVNGNLICGEQNLDVTAKWIMVHGVLQCGTDTAPFPYRLNVTLTGNNRNESVMGMGTKVLAAMNGGLISLHGEERTSWLMLAKTANAGDKTIELEYTTNWRVGDTIVIASTALDMNQAETRRIRKINGSVVTLDSPLKHRHFGEVQNFSNATTQWEVDTRAEVGLLTRNIRIQGDSASTQQGFGGHIMIMSGSIGLFSGVELFRMGQSGILARYPFHWHMAGDVGGQYFRNSTVRNSFNRCVTVHGSHNALVADNVCYDHIGHGYFLEDGSETGNTFDRNLGLVTRKPAANIALIPSDRQEGEAARGPSTFWISNGDNTVTNNAAAGSDGLGYWYDTAEKVTGSSASVARYRGVNPATSRFGVFAKNRVHSSDMAFSSCSESSGPTGYRPPNRAVYSELTVFETGFGSVWPCQGEKQEFSRLMVTDTGAARHAGFVAPRPVLLKDSLFVANSKLSEGGRGQQRNAIGIYDFGVTMDNVHFENYDYNYGGSYVFGARDADVRITSNPATNLTFKNSPLLYERRDRPEMRPSKWGAVIHDVDGSFGLGPNTALVADHPMMVDSTCTDNYGEGKLCDNRYGRVKIDFNLHGLPAMTHHRSDGKQVDAKPLAERGHYQSVVSTNHNRYHYGYSFDATVLRTGGMTVELQYLHNGDTAVLEFKNLPASARVISKDYTVAGSLQALKNGPGKQSVRVGGSLFVKLKTTGAKWKAADLVSIVW